MKYKLLFRAVVTLIFYQLQNVFLFSTWNTHFPFRLLTLYQHTFIQQSNIAYRYIWIYGQKCLSFNNILYINRLPVCYVEHNTCTYVRGIGQPIVYCYNIAWFLFIAALFVHIFRAQVPVQIIFKHLDYCSRVSVGLLSYNSRSTLMRLDRRRRKIGRVFLPI